MKDLLLKNRRLNISKLLSFGFTEKEGGYFYTVPVAGRRYFPGYHMNKKNRITICLDGGQSGRNFTADRRQL